MTNRIVLQLNDAQFDICMQIAYNSVAYFAVQSNRRTQSSTPYKLETDKQKQLYQTLCGIMAEYGVKLYIEQNSKLHYTLGVNTAINNNCQENYQVQDCVREDGQVIEIKSVQCAYSRYGYRMITPRHHARYIASQACVVWCEVDIDKRKVYIIGYNSSDDIQIKNMNRVQTKVANLQLKTEIPLRPIQDLLQ